MAKSKNTKITVEVDPDDLGVASRHHFLMANDEEYRTRALTPPGGNAPDVKLPDGHGLGGSALIAAAS